MTVDTIAVLAAQFMRGELAPDDYLAGIEAHVAITMPPSPPDDMHG